MIKQNLISLQFFLTYPESRLSLLFNFFRRIYKHLQGQGQQVLKQAPQART